MNPRDGGGGAPAPIVNGFWSYSSAMEDHGAAALHVAMQASLTEHLPYDAELFRDRHAETGIPATRDWTCSLPAAISRSVLFFWIQSPRWLRRPACRVEHRAFRDRCDRIAARFSTGARTVDAASLWEALTQIVRWAPVDASCWRAIDRAVEAELRHLVEVSQVALDFTRPPASPAGTRDFSAACHGAAPRIWRDLQEALGHLGVDLAQLQGFLAEDEEDFVRRWTPEFRGLLDLDPTPAQAPPSRSLLAQRAFAREHCDGRSICRHDDSGLDLVLAVSDDGRTGFWATARPVGGTVVEQASALLPPEARPRRGPGGDWFWTRDAVERLVAPLGRLGLGLPDGAEAALLKRLFDLDVGLRRALGWDIAHRAFWHQSTDGVAPHPEVGGALPLYLLSR